MKQEISFDVSREDADIILKIVRRARKNGAIKLLASSMDIGMDITACHVNGCPLRLADLLLAPQFDFMHDILGIRNNLNRGTGKLGNIFRPRYAKK